MDSRQGRDESDRECMDAASRYLGYRARSEGELRKYLRKRGFSSQCVERTLAQLREKGYTNDSAFARLWIENRESSKPRSRSLLRWELREKGINCNPA